ncbi:ParB/RepB/Spo0J family partition protein [Streptomyces viridochromogenes]|uniref:Putative transcriptional regulator n=1 Tax=Streptomyces viridochromogenes Tue57 TaxID=1160705 RepID=L8P1D1_STRVR|nr:ParB/RepB/Spo0J family partition protein [Streptomyces viridochromogenes]ELS50295.1 putative transcriptional regulator [Streptomyces viridochromogenes Tue57]
MDGQDREHIARLAEVETPFPPILVDRHTMRVIDGMHRLLATLWRGQQDIEVEFFDGPEEDAFLRAVEANVTHGFPLSQSDRRAAATKIMITHPHLSDRAIARSAGLGAKTVAAIRRRSADALPQLNARVGRDGKVRPVNSLEGRLRAAEVLADRPEASLREVARLAGISPATASDVRKRLSSGLPPASMPFVPPQRDGSADTVDTGEPREEADTSAEQQATQGHQPPQVPPEPGPVLDKLMRDPSLRHKEGGRHLLRLLQQNAIGLAAWSELSTVVPPHCGDLVARLARQYAGTWQEFAQELEKRERSLT